MSGSLYLPGPKPGGFGGKAASLAANEKPPKTAAAKRVVLPPSLNPKGDTRFTPPPAPVIQVRAHTRSAPVPKPVNTQRLELAHKAPRSRESHTPFYKGQKPSRYERPVTGERVATRRVPVYTLGKAGPSGQQGLEGVGGRVVTAEQAQAQLGTTPTVAMAALTSAVHPLTDLSRQATGETPFKLGGAASDVANIASNLIPGEKLGAAGLLGLRGLKALKDAKVGAEVVAPIAKDAAALRGAVSGTPARQALKGMTATEKAVAKIDNPNLGKSVRQLQKEQKQMYSVERGKRFAAAKVHLNNQALTPEERVQFAKHELKGELPKINFQGFTELSDQAVTAMQKHILDHPTLMPGQKITASDALRNALTGKLPTPSELRTLELVFGKDTTAGLDSISKHPFKDTVLSVLNVPRSLMASFDFSAPFRQGLAVATRHPTIFAKNLGPMFKSFGREAFYHGIHDEIHARATYPMMLHARLSLTELGGEIGKREEQFGSQLAEQLNLRAIPGVSGKYATGPGDVVRASGRAYTGFLDKVRADVFDHLIQRAQTQGINVQDDKFLKDLGRYINTLTGRGPLGQLQGAAPALNAIFFSPRLLSSRLDLIFSPLTYARADPFVRQEAIRSMVQLAGTASTLLALASQTPGVKVQMDPRNPDWGKIRIGNTRIDIAGGFQQPLRLFAQLATGVAISSTTGKRLSLTAGQFGQPTRLDLFLRFFEGKESPIASFATDALRNSNQVGQPFHLRTEVTQRLIPLLAQDSYDLYNAHHGGMNGLAAAFAGYGVGSVGLGMQTYGPGKVKGGSDSPLNTGSAGGGSQYLPSSSSGGGSIYLP